MSVDKSDHHSQSPGEQGENAHGTVDLENKLMRIGNQKYYVDMKQSPRARFFRIVEVIPKFQRSRIVVPMLVAADFCQKLEEVAKFALSYVVKPDAAKNVKERPTYVFSLSITTNGRRRYYFDLLEEEGSLKLKMSYVYGDRRDNVHMAAEALPNLIEILNEFVHKYPSLSEEEDLPPASSRSRKNFPDRTRRNFDSSRPRRSSKTPVSGTGERRVNLKVLQDPAPIQIDVNTKKFTFEVVAGTNTFLRVTEQIINGVRKSTLHVPVEACYQIQTIIGDMMKKLNIDSTTNEPFGVVMVSSQSNSPGAAPAAPAPANSAPAPTATTPIKARP